MPLAIVFGVVESVTVPALAAPPETSTLIVSVTFDGIDESSDAVTVYVPDEGLLTEYVVFEFETGAGSNPATADETVSCAGSPDTLT
jgi:hypothetical protein